MTENVRELNFYYHESKRYNLGEFYKLNAFFKNINTLSSHLPSNLLKPLHK